jgi:hypothetical protein
MAPDGALRLCIACADRNCRKRNENNLVLVEIVPIPFCSTLRSWRLFITIPPQLHNASASASAIVAISWFYPALHPTGCASNITTLLLPTYCD